MKLRTYKLEGTTLYQKQEEKISTTHIHKNKQEAIRKAELIIKELNPIHIELTEEMEYDTTTEKNIWKGDIIKTWE